MTQQAPAPCPVDIPSYTGNCGPRFVLPGWGDAGGWNDPSKYSTIKLVDINGDGKSELIVRNDDGLEIWEFNTTLGQWRPAVDSKGVTNCKNVRDVVECDGVGPGNGIVGGPVNFTALSTPPTAGSPCSQSEDGLQHLSLHESSDAAGQRRVGTG